MLDAERVENVTCNGMPVVLIYRKPGHWQAFPQSSIAAAFLFEVWARRTKAWERADWSLPL